MWPSKEGLGGAVLSLAASFDGFRGDVLLLFYEVPPHLKAIVRWN